MKKYLILFENKEIYYIFLSLLGSILISFIELIGVSSIPIFILVITDIEQIYKFLFQYKLIYLVNYIQNLETYNLILLSALILFLIFLFKNLLVLLILYFEGIILRNLTTNLSKKLFNIYINSPTILHVKRNSANIIRNITEEIEYVRASIRAAMIMIREFLTIFIITITIIFIDPFIAISVFILLGAGSVFFVVLMQNKLVDWGKKHQFHRGKQIMSINQGLGSIKDIKILNREDNVFRIFLKDTHGRMHYHFLQQFFSQVPRKILEVVAITSVLLIVLFFFYLNRPIEIMLPLLSLFAVSVIRFLPSLNVITSSYSTIKFYNHAVNLIIKEFSEYDHLFRDYFQKKEKITFQRTISVENLSFQYVKNSKKILENINLKINKGQAIGIIGKTGSGKTTLVENLIGLHKPQAGLIKIDEVAIKFNENKSKLSVGYVPQDIYLLDDTILKNVAFGIPDENIDLNRVNKCLEISNILEFINSLPDQLNTKVGERGIKLSGGQKQRIGIARSLYDNPDILVFDEGTSSLDNITENEIINGILKLKGLKTIIIIAHRLSTIKNCDNIILMENGRIIDEGSFDYLFSKHKLLNFPN
tara:strand:+ start:719 stop:2491 length:1773 start_codon:yes stop_codon:yes gene_type:complete